MTLTYEFDGLAKIKHSFKGVDFLIIIEEEMDEHSVHQCHTVFRAPTGKYRKDWSIHDVALKDLPEDVIKEMACESAYNWYERIHGWT